MSMSDLLPLVAAALNDEAAADAAKELATAREERDTSHKVEVLRAINDGDDKVYEDGETIVYGSALFEDGQYHSRNEDDWKIQLNKSRNICRLEDLRDCQICVGGGIAIASLDELSNESHGWVNGDETDHPDLDGDACSIKIEFCPQSTILTFFIRGWPEAEWKAVMEEEDAYAEHDIIPFLVENVAVQYPEAIVEFKSIKFSAKKIHGALKRLLPPKRKEQVRADREKRKIAREGRQEVVEFVESNMRERGIFDLFHWMAIVVLILGIQKRSEFFDRVIEALIAKCERSGMFTMEEANKIMSTMEEKQCSEDLGSDDEKSPK
eukprot:CAMPEP_0113438146 /NCGR_PEP_ID=MMETSP0013_2-20120614/37797_1 /TAXON_ID=2843 ORGANISM="Skeletonema costatum, Strain 1716" /NCGR_SAMPLE_ID=MMETSP0013_2 /ASSEMBLY_ACC=CAM_ASM_000158 /LENGTH=322 /DNA_ID=CAMNT_0000328855 /DNA_START=1 /DNA_END=969 /DNA_ORIENTATION=+ /assembly_acc=CAM_ASM_000158